MKNFLKFIPVALGMLALASCSNEDFLSDSSNADPFADLGDGDMVVNAPKPLWGGDAVTRALRNFVPNEDILYLFQRSDVIRVYDDALTKWDIYEYRQQDDQDPTSPLKFRRRHVTNLNSEATYALYPKEDVIDAKWEYTNESLNQTHTVAWVNIAPKMEYVAGYDRQTDTENKTPLYQDRLPLWGKVTANDKGYVESSLEYLTGILCFQMAGVNEYAKWLRVQLIDKDGKALNIAGQAQVELAVNNVLKMAYEDDGETVIEGQTARITTNDFVKKQKQEIVVDMTKDVQLSEADRKHAKVFVPLACTDVEKKAVCIVVSYANTTEAPTTEEGWVECWRQCNTVIERGRYYWNEPELNLAIDGTTPCAVSDALELMAQTANGKIVLSTKNPIQITEDCKRIVVPNTEYPVVIDLSKGVYGATGKETLTLEYEDPEGSVFPPSVTLIASKALNKQGRQIGKQFALDVQLGKGQFAIVDATALIACKIDATAVVVGDGETETNIYAAEVVELSDNVKELTVTENAALYTDCAFYIPNEGGNVGYKAAGLEKVTINGMVKGLVDARTQKLDITVEPGTSGNPAIWVGGARTLGTINALGKAVLVNKKPADNCPSDIYGFAAQGDVTVTGQSFILGPVFSWKGDINISNENLNDVEYFYNGGKLSNLIYDKLPSVESDYNFDDAKFGYGPLYAEEGSVKIEATNSKVVILKEPEEAEVATIQKMLNDKAKKAVTFAVYAAQDIDLEGEDITVKGKMWAENDVRLAGKTSAERRVTADHDFAIEDESTAYNVTVGRNATVDVDEQNGNCEAITNELVFIANPAEGNALNLKQGYIRKIVNGTADAPVEVKLFFSDQPAYAAIGEVTAPDALLSQNKSIWNGKQMPASLRPNYQNQTDIWTATQLAAQLENKISGETLRSDIDLKGLAWKGINSKGYYYALKGNDHTISNLNITGHGFINESNDLVVNNLTLSNVETNIAKQTGNQLENVGSLAGKVQKANLSRVLVIVKEGATIGSNGNTNILAHNIGGVLGLATGDVDFKGVRVNFQNGTVGGWYNLGGLLGSGEANVNIANGDIDDTHSDIFKTMVNKLGSLNVTYIDTRAVNDPFQGKTGLYIGSVDLDEDNDIIINSSDNANKKLTIGGVADESKAFVIDDEHARYFFIRGDQTLVGFCGFDNPEKIQIIINGKQYGVWKDDRDFKAGWGIFYRLVKENHVDEYGQSPYVDFINLP
jgi:uncharacterized protein YbdZ (MbtH family)/cytoskeletal protein CcmA (bactofilin family)